MTLDEGNPVLKAVLIGRLLLAQRPGAAELAGQRVRLAPQAGAASGVAEALAFLAGYRLDPEARGLTVCGDGPSVWSDRGTARARAAFAVLGAD